MLRSLLELPKQESKGIVRQVVETMQAAERRYRNDYHRAKGNGERQLRLHFWTKSMTASYDELEQSVFCAEFFALRVNKTLIKDMDEAEREDHRRHLYFYKNGFIRVFSVLDKLGSFMNEELSLHTERMKERYSYFTVLRRLRELHWHQELLFRLNECKQRHHDSLQDLRSMRNHEVHAMNAEWMDEHGKIRSSWSDPQKEQTENLARNCETLRNGFQMVSESLLIVFSYVLKK